MFDVWFVEFFLRFSPSEKFRLRLLDDRVAKLDESKYIELELIFLEPPEPFLFEIF